LIDEDNNQLEAIDQNLRIVRQLTKREEGQQQMKKDDVEKIKP
jgi:hypothetical protein